MNWDREATWEDAQAHGLSRDEYDTILTILHRSPNMVELGIFSALWSEHCSYKSSRVHLEKLPTQAPWVLQGPGENAGIVDIGGGLALAFKMESHNHPSYIEPFQGAATGVGGILRDIFTMGARPIACLDSLHFGDLSQPRMKYLVDRVVAGIAFYGNCMGIPTVGGTTTFYPAYGGNILVNAFALGIVQKDRIFRARAEGVGNPVMYVGSKTGRDGIHGATMASDEFREETESKRPHVQVGDPFTEKLLMEACLALMQEDSLVAIQDMGAAGLTSSSFEMAGKSGVGMVLHLDKVPQREVGMNPYEIMLSESQERMLLVVRKGKEQKAMKIFHHWGVDGCIIGEVTGDGKIQGYFQGKKVMDLPVKPLSTQSPKYDRPYQKPDPLSLERLQKDIPFEKDDPWEAAIPRFLVHPNLASKRWIWRQYDHMVRINTIIPPGLGASLLRIKGTRKAIALTTDVNPFYCFLDPYQGAIHGVCEAYRNLVCLGAKPLGVTDCLNFGNPEKPKIMGQFVTAIEGMREALLALNIPVVSGNVSFYNETDGVAIWPTPTIAMVGLVEDIQYIPRFNPPSGSYVYHIGLGKRKLEGSQWAYQQGVLTGTPPDVDLSLTLALGKALQEGYRRGDLHGAHDCSEGGLLLALLELSLACKLGVELAPFDEPLGFALFSEGAGNILAVGESSLGDLWEKYAIPYRVLGVLKGEEVVFPEFSLPLRGVEQWLEAPLPSQLGGP